jgi:hypothetical protein
MHTLKQEDPGIGFQSHFQNISNSLSEVFFAGLNTTTSLNDLSRQPKYDSLGYIEELSISGRLRTLKYISQAS